MKLEIINAKCGMLNYVVDVTCWYLHILQNIPFVILHIKILQNLFVFFMKRFFSMMFFLPFDVIYDCTDMRFAI